MSSDVGEALALVQLTDACWVEVGSVIAVEGNATETLVYLRGGQAVSAVGKSPDEVLAIIRKVLGQ